MAGAVAAALRPAWAGFLGFGRGRGIPAPAAAAFDYYISPTGSASNAGTLASPWDISVFAMTPNANTAAYYQGLMAGKRIGALPGTYPIYAYWNQQHNTGYAGTCLTIPSGPAGTPTYVASCDANGNYSPRTATFDAHPSATVGQSSVTLGVSARVTAVTMGTSTVITFNAPPLKPAFTSNPFAVNDQVWLADEQDANGWAAIGIQSDGPNTPGTYYTVTAASSGSGPSFTITINAATTSTWTPTTQSAPSTATTGGSLPDSTTYYLAVVASFASGATTILSGVQPITTGVSGASSNTVTANWTAVAGATGYTVYISTATIGRNEASVAYQTAASGATSSTFTAVPGTTGTTPSYGGPRYPTIYKNYPSLQGQAIGNSTGGGAGGPNASQGGWTIDGIILTGAFQNGIGQFTSKYTQFGNGEPNGGGAGGSSMLISAVTTGSTTTFTIPYSGASNPYAAGNIVYFKNLQATGTGETLSSLNLNSTTQNRYTIASVGGASGAWTFTINVATSGTFTTGTNAYVGNQSYPVTIQNCEIYDCEGEDNNNPAAIHLEVVQGALISNCKIHECMQSMGETNEAGGAFLGFCLWDATMEYCSMWNVQTGAYFKSLGQGNLTFQYNFVQTDTSAATIGANTVAVNQGQGQVIPGLALTVRNNIFVAHSLSNNTTSDGQGTYAGSMNWYNNTWYWPFNSGRDLYGAICMSNATGSGPAGVTPPAQGTFYNNLYNAQLGGSQINSSSYMAGMAAGTSAAPTSVNIALSNYNGYDGSTTALQFVLGKYETTINFGLGTYDLSTWQSATGLDLNSIFGTPTFSSVNLGYQYPTSNFQLATGSVGKGAGRIGGTSGGAATDMGAWGGIDVNTGLAPAQIGCNF